MVSHGYVIMSLSSELETFQTNIDFLTAVTRFQLKYFRIYLDHCVLYTFLVELTDLVWFLIELECDPDHYKHSFYQMRSQLLKLNNLSGKECRSTDSASHGTSGYTPVRLHAAETENRRLCISQDGRPPPLLAKK